MNISVFERVDVFVFLVLGFWLIAASACSPSSEVSSSRAAQSEAIARIERDTGLVLPTGSTVVRFEEVRAHIDPAWVAQVVMPHASVVQFMAAIAAKKEDASNVHGAPSESISWWKPGNPVVNKQFLVNEQTLVRLIVSKEEREAHAFVEYITY